MELRKVKQGWQSSRSCEVEEFEGNSGGGSLRITGCKASPPPIYFFYKSIMIMYLRTVPFFVKKNNQNNQNSTYLNEVQLKLSL